MDLENRPLLKNMVDRDERAKKEGEKVAKGKKTLEALNAKKPADKLRADQERTRASRLATSKEAEEKRAKLAEELNS